jgi:hypothetical protein
MAIADGYTVQCHTSDLLPSVQQTTIEFRTVLAAVVLKFFIGINNSDIGFSLNIALNTGNNRLAGSEAHKLSNSPS